ncbi:MAG: hypothetical protein IT376_21665 [Polyangiaceae bacterium]|nr:hypothetical protein [Polyangiaceae bacterium]
MSAGGSLFVRRALLLAVAPTAAAAVLGGLGRLGIVEGLAAAHAPAHGPLFVLGVFLTVISLERAVALGAGWSLGVPAVAASGAAGMLAGVAGAAWVSAGAALGLVAVNAAIVRRQSAVFTWLMLLGATALASGTVAWAVGQPVSAVAPAWIAFFVLTIAAERLELSRLAPTPRWATWVLASVSVALAGLSLALAFGRPAPAWALGAALALIGAWQLRFDLARRLVRQRGLPRFSAAGVLAAATWLLASGAVVALRGSGDASGPAYDLALHGVLIGYVLSMVFAHAPIILPAVARVQVPFRGTYYAPLAALHGGLLLRAAGDLLPDASLRRAGTLGNALALALFAATVLHARLRPAR